MPENSASSTAPGLLAVEQPLSQVAVQAVEVVAHPAKVVGELVGERDDLACTLDRAVVRQRADHAAAHLLDLALDAGSLNEQ